MARLVFRPSLLGLAIVAGMLGGCASFSRDGGFEDVRSIAGRHLKQDIAWQREGMPMQARTEELLGQPLGIDDAVQMALLNNRGLQASFAELGIAEADLVQAGRLPNPRFSMLYARRDGEYKIEQAFTFNVFSLLTMPQAKAIEQRRFEQTKRDVSLRVLALAQTARQAWVQAVAAEQSALYAAQVMQAAEAAAELARRMNRQGNWNKLDQAREQSFYADAALEYAAAREYQIVTRERLSRVLGLADSQHFSLPQRLPDLPSQENDLLQVQQQAFTQRLDLQAMRVEVDALAKQLGLSKTTRLINVLDIGPARVLEGRRSEAYKKGITLGFELPLFDWGGARVKRAEAIYTQALERTAQATVDAESEIRAAYARYRVRYEVARHFQDEIVPLRKRILQENQLRYNGMLLSAFELLADARMQVNSVNQYISAVRDFWLAEATLTMATLGPVAELDSYGRGD
ncbi:TolC family protein [Methylobacillus arboreus]|uniref:TolC family protein n=1 Tax=Methylobacillus arboreus TaxID=755170 RepID=UPI001E484039|nr:TolC family protein [Methylobacillus arboreus]MCB5191757.1 TolC family protein [Methylobacillus arboreus]